MQNAQMLLSQARSLGADIRLTDGAIQISRKERLTLDLLEKLRAARADIVFALAPLPWWRDPEAIRARFDEIAGMAEFDGNADRDEAERIAKRCLFGELTHAGWSRDTAIDRVNKASKQEKSA
jgi:hypothetical protein